MIFILQNPNLPDDANIHAPSPQEMAALLAALLRTSFTEDDALDLLKLAGDKYVWTWQLNLCGLLLLKPDALAGEEASS